jgi:hypothetical protein
MGSKSNFHGWDQDFAEFSSAEPARVPSVAAESVLNRIRTELNPSAYSVFAKTALIHTVVGGLTLLLCPQFGLKFTSSHGLMPYLMRFGEGACMLGCGALFTVLSLLVASIALRAEEVRVLKRNWFLQLAFLATLSLGALLCLGGEIVLTLAIIWAVGAIVGGAVSLEAGWAFRRYSAARRLA